MGPRTCGSRSLPEARLVVLAQLEPAHPLGALPEVEVRDEQARGASVLVLQRIAVVVVDDPGLPVGDVLDGEIRRVPPVAEREQVRGVVVYLGEKRVDGDALPGCVELRPAGDAVDVDRDGLARQVDELIPRPGAPLVAIDNRERPVTERRVRRGAGREHREVVRQVLTGRHPGRIGIRVAAAAAEST